MSQEVKVECVKCKAHYLVEPNYLDQVVCEKCSGRNFIQVKAPAPEAPKAPASSVAAQPAAPKAPAPAAAAQPGPASKTEAPKVTTPAAAKPPAPTPPVEIERLRKLRDEIIGQLDKVVVGQTNVVEELVIAILCGGHCLLEGVPGLAKTLLISSLARAMSCSFKRIQFTPDLMPSDITGTDVLQDDPITGERKFKFLRGPVFANIILADEINRTPPKTQASLLEAMQEKQVSVGGIIHKLEPPFFVLATQNPLEQEGTYPLPEAQQDRFLFKIFVDYPESADEIKIVRRVTQQTFGEIQEVCSGPELVAMQKILLDVPVADAVIDYANRLVRATRSKREGAVDFATNWLAWGAGPRATINLITAARCYSALQGRTAPSVDDVIRVAKPVLRHRIALNYVGKAEGLTTDAVVDKLVGVVAKY